jgi:hypothetical protein
MPAMIKVITDDADHQDDDPPANRQTKKRRTLGRTRQDI